MGDERPSFGRHARTAPADRAIHRGAGARHGLPVHVVYGENDDAWPLAMQDQMARDLDAPVTVIPDAGHCPNEDRPEDTAAVIADFWDTIN